MNTGFTGDSGLTVGMLGSLWGTEFTVGALGSGFTVGGAGGWVHCGGWIHSGCWFHREHWVH